MITKLIIGNLIVLSILTTWFSSSFPVHYFQMLRRLGWGKKLFWPKDAYTDHWTRSDWELWATMYLQAKVPLIGGSMGELIQCPTCLSWHISFWTALGLAWSTPHPFTFLVIGTLIWPGVAVNIYCITHGKS